MTEKIINKSLIIAIALIIILGSVFIYKTYIEKSGKILQFSEHNVENIDFRKEIDKIKEAYNVKSPVKIESFEVTYKRDGTVKWMRLYLVNHESNKYYLYDANYDIETKVYKVNFNQSNEWLQYSRLYDESQFVNYIKQFDFNHFKPKIDSSEYDSYSIKYFNNTGGFSTNSNFDIYIVQNGKANKLTDRTKTVEGFALWVYGNKIYYYKDHASEQGESSNVYIFI